MRRLHWRPRAPALPNLVALSGSPLLQGDGVARRARRGGPSCRSVVARRGECRECSLVGPRPTGPDRPGPGGIGGIGFGCRRCHDGRRPWLLGGGVERRRLQLRRCVVLRIGGRADPRCPDRRHGRHGRWPRVLAGRFRRRRVLASATPRSTDPPGRCISTRRSWGWRRRPMVTGTGWSPPTVACSASATPPSTDPQGRCISTRRSWGWPSHRVVAGTGSSRPTVASSASAPPRSPDRRGACT